MQSNVNFSNYFDLIFVLTETKHFGLFDFYDTKEDQQEEWIIIKCLLDYNQVFYGHHIPI